MNTTRAREKRLLFIQGGPSFLPDEIPVASRFELLSREFSGDIVAIVNHKDRRDRNLHRFRVRGLKLPQKFRFSSLRVPPFMTWAFCTSLWRHWTGHAYDAVVAHDPLATGLLGLCIARATGARLIVEVNGNFSRALGCAESRAGFGKRARSAIARRLIPFILNRADAVKLLYDDQLTDFREFANGKAVRRFHEFVPVKRFSADAPRGDTVLFLGYPWFLKGVDVLIRAFREISARHPGYRLLIVGYCPDKKLFTELAAGDPRIVFKDPVWYDEAMKLIETCAFFVLPSRTEAMGRVLLEAMASRRPIIASAVDGIPTYVRDGFNGLLFRSENVAELAQKLELLMSDPALADTLADNGYEYVHGTLSEERYLEGYRDLVECALGARESR